MIDYRIRTFLTLCEEMNYRKTAERLNMTQPAVTQQIQYLEQEYGHRLFVYDRRVLRMTREAAKLRAYAQNVCYQERKLRDELSETEHEELTIGATKTIGDFVIGKQVSRWIAAEEARLTIEVNNTDYLLPKVADGTLDFAIIEGLFDRREFASTLYREEPFVGICNSEHPFAGKTVPYSELCSEHLLLREEGSGTRDIFCQMLKEHNHSLEEFRRVTAIGSFGLMTQVLQSTGGITFAYRALLSQSDSLREFHVEGWGAVREFNYVYLDTPAARDAVERFDSYRHTDRG